MTIEVQTGLPGHGKTLYTLDRIETLRRKTGRPVYYSGIPIIKEKLPSWVELEDPKKWFECPPESIVVIDEAQRIFRPRASGSVVPEYESALETHRHGGIDLVLLTQRPRLLSVNVRELCGRHLHMMRTFGMQRATIHEWQECKLNTQSRGDSIKHMYRYNREVYGWYKSAEAHTYKTAIPMKVWVLGSIIVGLPVLIGAIWMGMQDKMTEAEKEAEAAKLGGVAGPSAALAPGQAAKRALTAGEYVDQFKPRVNGLAYTAAAYDEVTKPVRAPYPAACVQGRARCQCYTQQGTKLETTKELCQGIVAGGFFMAWDEEKGRDVARPISYPVAAEKLSGGNVDGLVNLTPGYSERHAQPVNVAQVEQDGAGVRGARRRQ